MKRVYLDNNATTSLHPEVAASIVPFLEGLYGNPSSLHWAGRDVRIYYDRARLQIADMMHAHPEEIVVTSCGTESDNHAIKGIAYGNSEKGGHIITTAIEHPGVLNVCKYLEGKGFAVTYLPVDGKGQIEPDRRKKGNKEGYDTHIGNVCEQ